MKTKPCLWQSAPVFCSGETHVIKWTVGGQFYLPAHGSFTVAEVEANLLKNEQRIDNLCLVVAAALRGSARCWGILMKVEKLVNPDLMRVLHRAYEKRRLRSH